MLIYDVGFLTTDGKEDETQIEVEEGNQWNYELIEMFNIILELQKEMDIKKIQYIDYVENTDDWEEED